MKSPPAGGGTHAAAEFRGMTTTQKAGNMMTNADLQWLPLSPQYDAAVAELVRSNLRAYGLDIPGTAYYDEWLDHLSDFYREPGRAYEVLLSDGQVIGGVGLAAFEGDCCELQKLYLADAAKGRGLGYVMMAHIEDLARRMGYRQVYLETHSNLKTALHLYEKTGYRRIERPASVIHSTMDRFYLKVL